MSRFIETTMGSEQLMKKMLDNRFAFDPDKDGELKNTCTFDTFT